MLVPIGSSGALGYVGALREAGLASSWFGPDRVAANGCCSTPVGPKSAGGYRAGSGDSAQRA